MPFSLGESRGRMSLTIRKLTVESVLTQLAPFVRRKPGSVSVMGILQQLSARTLARHEWGLAKQGFPAAQVPHTGFLVCYRERRVLFSNQRKTL